MLVRILRRLAMAPNYLFARHNPYQPVGFGGVPGNFHSVGMHRFPPCLQFIEHSTPRNSPRKQGEIDSQQGRGYSHGKDNTQAK